MRTDPVEQLGGRGVLRVAEPLQQPQLLGLVRGGEQRLRVLDREVVVRVAVHDEQRDRRDPADHLDRRLRHLGPAVGGDPRLERVPGDQPAEARLDRPVQPAHRLGAAVEPAAHRRDADDAVDVAEERGVPQHHRAAHRPAAGDHVGVPELAGMPHRRVEVEDLLVAQRRVPGRAAVAAEVERHHAGVLRQRVDDRRGRRACRSSR